MKLVFSGNHNHTKSHDENRHYDAGGDQEKAYVDHKTSPGGGLPEDCARDRQKDDGDCAAGRNNRHVAWPQQRDCRQGQQHGQH